MILSGSQSMLRTAPALQLQDPDVCKQDAFHTVQLLWFHGRRADTQSEDRQETVQLLWFQSRRADKHSVRGQARDSQWSGCGLPCIFAAEHRSTANWVCRKRCGWMERQCTFHVHRQDLGARYPGVSAHRPCNGTAELFVPPYDHRTGRYASPTTALCDVVSHPAQTQSAAKVMVSTAPAPAPRCSVVLPAAHLQPPRPHLLNSDVLTPCRPWTNMTIHPKPFFYLSFPHRCSYEHQPYARELKTVTQPGTSIQPPTQLRSTLQALQVTSPVQSLAEPALRHSQRRTLPCGTTQKVHASSAASAPCCTLSAPLADVQPTATPRPTRSQQSDTHVCSPMPNLCQLWTCT